MEKFQLLVVQTGGTIDKDYPKRKGGYSFEICESGALSVLRKVSPYFRFRLLTACLQDSQDLTDHHRHQIAKVCQEAEEKYILVTHGTDTILQTAAFLAKYLHQDDCVSPNQSRTPDKGNQSESSSQSTVSDALSQSSNELQTSPEQNVSTSRNAHKVIVLTGAFLPERFKDTDADFNVGVVVGAMQGGLHPGVYVTLGGIVWRWDQVTRSESGQFCSL